jgi:glycosyltransferase involved in cell wall biosynthesis
MKHIIITRINFKEDFLFKKYFEVMKNTYIPSIKSQKNKNFKIGFIVNSKHIGFLKKFFEDALFFSSISESREYCINNRIPIQTRHDCDDWMREDYIDTIQKIYEQNVNKSDVFLIHTKVQKLNLDTGDLYSRGDVDYTNNRTTSMFLTLCQKNVNNFIYDQEHTKMKILTNNIFLMEEGYTRLVIHGNNKLSKIHPKDIFLKKIEDYDLSVIIPTYNNVDFIDNCVKSIIKSKKNKKIQILIGIDNCEKTKKFVINNISKYDNDINFYLFPKKVGPYVIRNSLTKQSKSKNILFVDSDDLIHENLIENSLNYLKYYDIYRFKFSNFEKESQLLDNILKISSFHTVGAFAVKKEIITNLNGFEPWICAADAEFKMREIGNKLKVYNDEKCLYFRRVHGNNLTLNPETNINSKIRNEYKSIIEYKKNNGEYGKLLEMPITKFFLINKDTKLEIVNSYDNLELFKKNTQKKEVELSIIIPTFNTPEFLLECLDSIITSIKNKNCEVFVGIDGCEKTLNFIKNKKFDKRIYFKFFEKNVGTYVVKNTLASISNANNLLFFDSDDIMLETFIEDTMSFLKNYKMYKPKYFDFKDINEIKNIEKLNSNKFGEGVFSIDKEIFLSFNGFEGWKCAADSDFMGRFYNRNIPFTHGQKISFLRRIHPNSLTKSSETSMSSKLRAGYVTLSKIKRPNEKCVEFKTSEFVNVNTLSLTYIPTKDVSKPESEVKSSDILKKIRGTNPQQTNYNGVDYDKLNKILYSQGVYDPKKNTDKPKIVQNKPIDRNKLIQIKKGSNLDALKKNLPGKPDRRKDTPNIFSKKNNR